jgi:fructokinase
MYYGAVEGGGQSWRCAISLGTPENIVESRDFKTESPEVTLGAIRAWLQTKTFDCLGIASFGPIDARKSSPKYGFITSTPKQGWTDTDVLTLLGMKEEFKHIPYAFDTDVNAPALAEYIHMLSVDASVSSCAYITVGTGVGVGLVVNGRTVHGLMHPEAGHIIVGKRSTDDFAGVCGFHGCCVEGRCSSVALAERAKVSLSQLPTLADDNPVWDDCAFYLAALCANIILMVCPERIVLSGGVMNRTCLYAMVRAHVVSASILNEYIQIEALDIKNIDQYIAPSRWGDRAGIIGALYLAKTALDK